MRQSRRTTLHVHLLGRLDVRTGSGRQVRISNRHAQALFALLVLSARPRSREAIAVDLWPDSDGASGSALRQALWLLRNALSAAGVAADSVLDLETDTVGIHEGSIATLDIAEFQLRARGGRESVEAAVASYTGDLVEGLTHECFAAERERLSDLYEDVLALAAASHLAGGRFDRARAAAESLVARDPLREEAHAVLIAVHGHTGSRSQVARQYRRLRTVLAAELDVHPLPETEVTYELALAAAVARSAERAATMPRRPRDLVVISA